MDLSTNKNIFLIFLSIRFLTTISMVLTFNHIIAFKISGLLFSSGFLVSLILTYRNSRLGTYLFFFNSDNRNLIEPTKHEYGNIAITTCLESFWSLFCV